MRARAHQPAFAVGAQYAMIYSLCRDLAANARDYGHCYPEFERHEQLTLAIFFKRLAN